MYLLNLSHLLFVFFCQFCQLGFQLLIIFIFDFLQFLLFDPQFDLLRLLILEFEDIILVVFSAGPTNEYLVLGRGGFRLEDFRKDYGVFCLFLGVIDRIDNIFCVHSLHNNKKSIYIQRKPTEQTTNKSVLFAQIIRLIDIPSIKLYFPFRSQQQFMKVVKQYLDNNKAKVLQIFQSSSKDGEMPATTLFSFLQQILQLESIRLIREGREYFKDEENQSHTEKIIEQYYKTTPDGKSTKFYLYRINFSFQQIQQYLQYWLSTDKSVKIEYPAYVESIQPTANSKQSQSKDKEPINIGELRQSTIIDNQFIVEDQKISLIIDAYHKQIDKLEGFLLKLVEESQEAAGIHQQIKNYKDKIQELSKNKRKEHRVQQIQSSKSRSKSPSPSKSKTEVSRSKKQVNIKALFEFYAKQNHLTGVKASFQRIQHESQTINYQKLVHFLKEYDLFPEKPKDQKKLHNLYVRVCSSTRDLNYTDFMQLLQKLPEIIDSSSKSSQQKKEWMMNKIKTRSQKDTKLLHNPFHSLEKNDFRIDSLNLKYSFKLQPLKGKLEEEVTNQLQSRKLQKQFDKRQISKEKQQKQIHKLKKLMAIDPYHPLVLKNAYLLQQKERSISMMEPIANLENMERFRDNKFDMKARFGIVDVEQDLLKQVNYRYDANKRADAIQKAQSQRMSNIMNGLVERSQAKLQKYGSSPRKREHNSMVN